MDNKRRVLGQVLSIDAWHEPMRFDGTTFKVHVELSFKEGRVGGDRSDFPFTFNVALKRALLTLTLEKPLAIDRHSIARGVPSTEAEVTRVISAKDELKRSAQIGGKLSSKDLSASVSASRASDHAQIREDQMKLIQAIPRIIALPQPGGRQEYAWELRPGQTNTLDGQPWDPIEQPRFSVKIDVDGRPQIEPVIKAVVSCKLEDIEINSLELKDKSAFGMIKEAAFHRVNIAAAIQHLKFTLRDMELETGGFGDVYSLVTIADVIVTDDDNG